MRTILLYNKYDWTITRNIALLSEDLVASASAIIQGIKAFPRSTTGPLEADDLADAAEAINALGEGEETELRFLGSGYRAKRTDGAPHQNEVWLTRDGNPVLIVNSPDKYFEVDGPPNHATPGLVLSRRSLMALWYDGASGWTVMEIRERLKERTNMTPAEFFRQAQSWHLRNGI